jgi:hypothetical protein
MHEKGTGTRVHVPQVKMLNNDLLSYYELHVCMSYLNSFKQKQFYSVYERVQVVQYST